MSKRKDVIHKAILRSNSHKVVKLPKEIIEELGWKISENVNIIISNVSQSRSVYSISYTLSSSISLVI